MLQSHLYNTAVACNEEKKYYSVGNFPLCDKAKWFSDDYGSLVCSRKGQELGKLIFADASG